MPGWLSTPHRPEHPESSLLAQMDERFHGFLILMGGILLRMLAPVLIGAF